ncbi:hypothetical protein EDB81DRAFT_882464 [Dactylonectria macrodidyma]|uniref:AAA+ ATPase domain-containing protein n=1 Tax=Dactylonectria macrodidyma TaxID=307937 RepID=A0A9P9F332_9HYPO|nr:hypothetical protein EDB81DRAFT_882464 [Dactylonectria macrodidyma]
MPAMIGIEMDFLKIEIDKRHIKDESLNPWTCEIEVLTMDDWKRDIRGSEKKPVPVLQVYYQRLSQAISLEASPGVISQAPKNMALDMIRDQKNLQRIFINSNILHAELEFITSTTISFPVIIGPPYKILLQYLPLFETRLAELRDELAETTMDINNNDYEVNTTTRAPDTNDNQTTQRDHVSEPNVAGKKTNSPDTTGRAVQLEVRISHLQCLLDFVNNNLSGLIELRDDIKSGILKEIAFDDLWHLFKPGDLVVSKSQGQEQLHTVHFVTGGRILPRPPQLLLPPEAPMPRTEIPATTVWSPFIVDAYMMAFDGNQVGPEGKSWDIKHYLGKRLVTELPIYPAQLHPDPKNLLARMEARGRKFMKSLGHKYYEGLAQKKAWRQQSRAIGDDDIMYEDEYVQPQKRSQEYIASEVFVDFEAYREVNRFYKPILGKLLRSKQDQTEVAHRLHPKPFSQKRFTPAMRSAELTFSGPEVDTKLAEDYMAKSRDFLEPFKPTDVELSKEHYQLLPSEVPGYTFRYRMWYILDVSNLQDIDTTRNSRFDDLVIPERHRSLLVALVDNHTSGFQRRQERFKKGMKVPDNAQIDLVPGKGQGLIILLHGPPGSGKTSTAETIAAYTRRPLYAITCGDLGLDPESVEKQLSNHALRAEKWGCVLLLDEADVFLVSRTHRELMRNALVSVFLRQLEYYSGILFLTTNRPGTLDEAFKSRIHVSLRYAELDLDSTRRMWNNILSRLETENKTADIKVKFDRQKLLDFAEQHYKKRQKDGKSWNGRQVRNAFQTALALGHFDRQKDIKASGQTIEEVVKTGKKKWMTVKLTKTNFQSIARTMHEFEDYIVKLRGKDSETAREGEVRDDYYDPDPVVEPARKNYGATSLPKRMSFELPHQYQADRAYPATARTRKRQTSTHDVHGNGDDEDEDEDEDDDDDESDEDEDEEDSAEV